MFETEQVPSRNALLEIYVNTAHLTEIFGGRKVESLRYHSAQVA